MLTSMRTLILAAIVLALVACTGGGEGSSPAASPDGSGPPTETPVDSPTFGAIEHPTGPTDIVLRYEEGGGFVMPAFFATQAPNFTLYGDGTIIFRNQMLEPLEPVGSVFLMHPFKTARLSEEQIQDLLTSALGEFGLGAARGAAPDDR